MAFPLPLETRPMEARLAEDLPAGEGWRFEPKWDGFRCLVFKDGKAVDLRAKSGKPLSRYFPDVTECVRGMKARRFVIDGELVIVEGGAASFEALQLRLHPAASRVAKLAAEQPAQLIAFDCLASGTTALLKATLDERRDALEAILDQGGCDCVRLSPSTDDIHKARAWLKRSGRALDGVIAKRVGERYVPG
jgi:ATP-dependent DNA ligase